MLRLIERVIASNDLDKQELLDLCSAICISDKFVGTNRLELSFSRFLKYDSEEWKEVLSELGVEPSFGNSLPRVQCYRVICDALVIMCRKQGKTVGSLTSEASSVVANLYNLNLRSTEYLDINQVERILTELVEETYGFSEIHDIEGIVEELDKELSPFGCGISQSLKSILADLTLPDKFIYINNGGMSCKDEEQALDIVKEKVIFTLEREILVFLRSKYSKDPVRTNLFLTRALKEVGIIGLGTVSMRNYAPSLEFENELPTVIRVKVQSIFNRSMNYDFDDLQNIVIILRNLYKGKVGDKYGI